MYVSVCVRVCVCVEGKKKTKPNLNLWLRLVGDIVKWQVGAWNERASERDDAKARSRISAKVAQLAVTTTRATTTTTKAASAKRMRTTATIITTTRLAGYERA